MGGFRLEVLPAVLDVPLDFSVTPARVEIVILHLLISPIVIPTVVVESVHRSHETGPMTATRTVNIKRPVAFVFGYAQELINHFIFGIIFITHWNIEIMHLCAFGG